MNRTKNNIKIVDGFKSFKKIVGLKYIMGVVSGSREMAICVSAVSRNTNLVDHMYIFNLNSSHKMGGESTKAYLLKEYRQIIKLVQPNELVVNSAAPSVFRGKGLTDDQIESRNTFADQIEAVFRGNTMGNRLVVNVDTNTLKMIGINHNVKSDTETWSHSLQYLDNISIQNIPGVEFNFNILSGMEAKALSMVHGYHNFTISFRTLKTELRANPDIGECIREINGKLFECNKAVITLKQDLKDHVLELYGMGLDYETMMTEKQSFIGDTVREIAKIRTEASKYKDVTNSPIINSYIPSLEDELKRYNVEGRIRKITLERELETLDMEGCIY